MKLTKYLSILLLSATIISFNSIETFATTSQTENSKTSIHNKTKRYIVKFKGSSADRTQALSNHKGNLKKQFKNINAAIANLTDENLAQIKSDSNVAYVEIDNPVKISGTLTTNSVNWAVGNIKATESWQSGLTGKGVKIAVIDTGIAPHQNLTVMGGTNVIMDSSTTSYADDNGHGTHIAGIINGQGVNGGVEGVAPEASVYAVKALDSSGGGYTSDIISGIDWAITNKMDIISMSLGSSTSSIALQNAVDTAYNNGLLVVAAAGNSGNISGTGTSIEYPANYSSAIAVGAVDSTNTRAYFSATGSKLEVSSPGVGILSTYLNGGYATMSGTSMATPFVAADLALLKQKYPTYTNIQLRKLLNTSSIDLGEIGRDSLYGYGLIQAPLATKTITVESPLASIKEGTYSSSQTITLSNSTPGTSIYYTLDGTIPTSASNLYTAPITISSTKTLKAIAIDTSGNSSSVFSATYTIIPKITIATPTTNVQAGTYKLAQSIKLSDATPGVSIYYTLDGTTPTSGKKLYSVPITISETTTLKAIAIDAFGNQSKVLSVPYKIIKPVSIPTPKPTLKSGVYKEILNIRLSTNFKESLKFYYTLDGSTPTINSIKYNGNIKIKSTTTLKAIAVDKYGNKSDILTANYTIAIPPAQPKFSMKGKTITINASNPNVSIYYTTNRSMPTSKSILYKNPIEILKSTSIAAVAIDAKGISSKVKLATFRIR